MRIQTFLAALGLAAGLLLPGAASAAIVDGTLEFVVPGFKASDPAAPQDTLQGSVHIRFDTAVSVSNSTTTISAVSLNLIPSTTLAYSYDAGQDILTIGGLGNGVANLALTGQDFVLSVQNLFGGKGPLIVLGAYFIQPDAFSSAGLTGRAAMVPEPASMLVLGAGLLGLAAVRRRG